MHIQKHLSQSVAVCGKIDLGRHRQSQVQPGTARYSAEKTHHVSARHCLGIIWGMSEASPSSGACLGQSKISDNPKAVSTPRLQLHHQISANLYIVFSIKGR